MAITRYHIQLGDEEIIFEGPDGLSDAQIEDLAQKQLRTAKPGQSFKHPVYAGEVKPERDPNESSAFGSWLRGGEHGFYSNFDDELTAGGNALIPGMAALDKLGGTGNQVGPGEGDGFWDRFKANMADLKNQRLADEELHPTASAFGNVTGGVTQAVAGAKGLGKVAPALMERIAAAAAARPIATTAGLGAASGTVSGAGAGEEGTRGQSAALGGIGGTALGLGLGSAIEFGPALANYSKVFFNKLPHNEAVRQIVKSLMRDGFDVTSPSGVQKIKSALQEFSGKPVALADIGAATRARAGVGLRTPSDVQQQSIDVVHNRQAGQGQRLASDVRATVAPRTDVHAINDDLVAQRAEEAEKLRRAALFEQAPDPAAAIAAPKAGVERTLAREVAPTADAPVVAGGFQSRVVNDPMLQQLARLPDAQKALQGAVQRAESERALRAVKGEDTSDIPDIHAGADLDVRTFDYLKRFLDDEVNTLYRKGDTATFKAAQAGQVKALRDSIRDRLRTVVPEYGDYLDAYKGSSEMIDSLEAGQKYDALPPEVIQSEQASRSTAGQELYRTGAARNILDKIRVTGDTRNPASRILNSDESRAQLAATGLDPANAARLNRSVEQERILNLLPQELSGSSTAQRLTAQEDAASGGHIDVPLMAAQPLSWLAMGARRALGHVSTTRNASVNEQILPRLLETNPQAIDGIIKELEDYGNIALAKQLRRQAAARRAGFGGGTVIGSPVALPSGDE